jgi:hypothetical protein
MITDGHAKFDVSWPIIRIDPYDRAKMGMRARRRFNYARCYNIAIDYAIKNGMDWFCMADSDFVLLRRPSTFPESNGTYAPAFVQSSRFPDEQILTSFGRNELPIMPSYYFLIHKSVFTRHRFCEEFSGWGFFDTEYALTCGACDETIPDLLGQREAQFQTDMRIVHMWHPHSARQINREDTARNGEILMRRLWQLRDAKTAERHAEMLSRVLWMSNNIGQHRILKSVGA